MPTHMETFCAESSRAEDATADAMDHYHEWVHQFGDPRIWQIHTTMTASVRTYVFTLTAVIETTEAKRG